MSERKYRQRGYMEREAKPEHEERKQPKVERDGPRGRGLGAPTATVWRCRVCGARQQTSGGISRDATCGQCGNDLHTCSNCNHFDGSRPNECRQPVLIRIAAKSKRNDCELFVPASSQEFAADRVATHSDPRAAFDALFRKK
jgi:hypothetical protein